MASPSAAAVINAPFVQDKTLVLTPAAFRWVLEITGQSAAAGNVVGPATSIPGALAVFVSATGDEIDDLTATAASRLLGRGSLNGAGIFEEITLGAGLTMTGTVLAASASGDGFPAALGHARL